MLHADYVNESLCDMLQAEAVLYVLCEKKGRSIYF